MHKFNVVKVLQRRLWDRCTDDEMTHYESLLAQPTLHKMGEAAPLIWMQLQNYAICKLICMCTHKTTLAHMLNIFMLCVHCGTVCAQQHALYFTSQLGHVTMLVQLCLHNPHTYKNTLTKYIYFLLSFKIDLSIWCSTECEIIDALSQIYTHSCSDKNEYELNQYYWNFRRRYCMAFAQTGLISEHNMKIPN